MDNKYTRYAAVLTTCGLFLYGSGGLSITPQQMADIFALLDKPKPIQAVLEYLDGLDIPGNDEVTEYGDGAFNEVPNLLHTEHLKYSITPPKEAQ